MSENDNWRAKWSEHGWVLVAPFGHKIGEPYPLGVAMATELRDQLNTALEEAKRLEDPFEKWWAGLLRDGLQWEFVRIGGWNTAKSSARAIWDAARKAAL